MYLAVTDDQVAAYLPLIGPMARHYSRYRGGDYDDLRQEGMISVWNALRRGNHPSAQVIRWAMLMWLRFQRRLMEGDAIAGHYVSLSPEWQAEFGLVLAGAGKRYVRGVPSTHPPKKF